MSLYVRRQSDPYTRAVSFVVSRGFGLHISLTLWWFSVNYHRRDRELEAILRAAARDMEEKIARD